MSKVEDKIISNIKDIVMAELTFTEDDIEALLKAVKQDIIMQIKLQIERDVEYALEDNDELFKMVRKKVNSIAKKEVLDNM